jgi:hypothetical protein
MIRRVHLVAVLIVALAAVAVVPMAEASTSARSGPPAKAHAAKRISPAKAKHRLLVKQGIRLKAKGRVTARAAANVYGISCGWVPWSYFNIGSTRYALHSYDCYYPITRSHQYTDHFWYLNAGQWQYLGYAYRMG